jgi:3-oxoacyl-[acyl-carrier-protein] synthase-3
MPNFLINGIKITGISSAVPSQVIEVDSFEPIFGEENVQKFKAMTGVKTFRKAMEYQTASDLGYAAAKNLLIEKDIKRDKVGALLFSSHSPDYRRPATACVLHKRLGLSKECMAFDIALGCSAFVYGFQSICSLMLNSNIDQALLIIAETQSKNVHQKDRSVAMLFGDAGSAVLIEKVQGSNPIQGMLRTDGNGYKLMIIPAGGFRNMHAPTEPMIWPDGNERTLYNIVMNGTDVFNFTISEVPRIIKDFFVFTHTTVIDYDCFALHQANAFILKQISRKLKISMEKIPVSLDRYGNTSAAAIPLTLCDKYGKSDNGSVRTLMCGFGIGLSWGVVAADIELDAVYPIFETDEAFSEGFINNPEQL